MFKGNALLNILKHVFVLMIQFDGKINYISENEKWLKNNRGDLHFPSNQKSLLSLGCNSTKKSNEEKNLKCVFKLK